MMSRELLGLHSPLALLLRVIFVVYLVLKWGGRESSVVVGIGGRVRVIPLVLAIVPPCWCEILCSLDRGYPISQ